jgi:large subunit ribosomal protein L32
MSVEAASQAPSRPRLFPGAGARYPSASPSIGLVIPLAVPKRKTSKQRRDTRRATHSIEATRMGRCPRCSSPVRTHHVCGVCGYYRGRPVVEIEG